jgi:O-antigen/teichoic acid export membrane protein
MIGNRVNGIHNTLLDALQIVRSRRFRQIGTLYSTMILSVGIGIVVSIFNTRTLGPQAFGDMRFMFALFSFIVPFIHLGLFVSGSRQVALKENQAIKQNLIGALYVLAGVMSLVMSLGMFLFSFFENRFFHNELGVTLRIASFLLFMYPFQLCVEAIMSGDNRIYELSAFRLLPKILYLAVAFVFIQFIPLNALYSVLFYLVANGALAIFFVCYLHPSLKGLRANLTQIWKANKTHGLQVYIGAIASQASANLGGLIIGFLLNNLQVGLYSLAMTITEPLVLISGSIATSWFKDFANRKSIPRKATLTTLFLSVLALGAFLLLIDKVIVLLYSKRYSAVIPLTYIIAVGSIVHGFGDYLNRFISAHGAGKYNRNGSIVVGVVNLLGFFLLIRLFGLKGAAYTRVCAGLVYCLMMWIYYLKLRARLRDDPNLGD